MMDERKKYGLLLLTSFVVLIIVFFVSLCFGRVKLSLNEIVDVIFKRDNSSVAYNVVINLRLYRILVGMLVGGSLAISGSIYQSIFNNKLVSPDILGVSSGASVGACLSILCSLSNFIINVSAFLFGLLSVVICLFISYIIYLKSNITLILAGIVVSGFMSSIVGLLKFLADNEFKLAEMTFWLLGDLSKVGEKEFIILIFIFTILFGLSLILSWRLDIISLGKKESLIVGNNYNLYLIIYIIIATILTSSSVAICGTISWIGLIVPNIVRLLVGNNNKNILPISALFGAIFLSMSDMLARTISPNEIPLSVVIGIIGTPIFIYVLFKRKKQIE